MSDRGGHVPCQVQELIRSGSALSGMRTIYRHMITRNVPKHRQVMIVISDHDPIVSEIHAIMPPAVV